MATLSRITQADARLLRRRTVKENYEPDHKEAPLTLEEWSAFVLKGLMVFRVQLKAFSHMRYSERIVTVRSCMPENGSLLITVDGTDFPTVFYFRDVNFYIFNEGK